MIIVSANDGAFLAFDTEKSFDEPVVGGDAVAIATWLKENGVTDWFYSSSMDFATEYGFDEDNQRSPIEQAYDAL